MVFYDKKLSNNQKDIIDRITNLGQTPSEIANSRGIKRQSVHKTIKKLREKGYNLTWKRGADKKGGVVAPKVLSQESDKKWRYHALEFEIRPYHFYDRYYSLLKERGNHSTIIGNWKYIQYYKKIIVWLEAGEEFAHLNRDEAIRLATKDFNKVLKKIQHDCGCEIWKDRRASIKLLKHHLAYTNAPEWEIVTEEEVFVQFKDKNDEVFLQYDRSRGIKEREYVHHKAIDHSDSVEKQFQDFIEKDPPTNSEIHEALGRTVMLLERKMEADLVFAEDFNKHTALVRGVVDLAKYQKQQIKEIKKKAGQTKLEKWF